MRTSKSSSDTAKPSLIPNLYTFTVHILDDCMIELGDICLLYDVQAHRSLLPVSDDRDARIYSVQLQVSAYSQASAFNTVFEIGKQFGHKIVNIKTA